MHNVHNLKLIDSAWPYICHIGAAMHVFMELQHHKMIGTTTVRSCSYKTQACAHQSVYWLSHLPNGLHWLWQLIDWCKRKRQREEGCEMECLQCGTDKLIWPSMLQGSERYTDGKKQKKQNRTEKQVYQLQGCGCPDMISKLPSYAYTTADRTAHNVIICVSQWHYLIVFSQLSYACCQRNALGIELFVLF